MALVDGDPVLTWTDVTTTATLTAAAGDAPTLKTNIVNGHAVVRFDGTEYMNQATNPLSDLVGIAGFTVFIVAANLTAKTWASFISTSNWPNHFNIYHSSRTNNGIEFLPAMTSSKYLRGNVDVTPGPSLITCRYDGTEAAASRCQVFLNSVLMTNVTLTGTPDATTTFDGAFFRMGWDGHGFLDGDIAEIAMYDRTVTSGEQSAIESALMSKYGI